MLVCAPLLEREFDDPKIYAQTVNSVVPECVYKGVPDKDLT